MAKNSGGPRHRANGRRAPGVPSPGQRKDMAVTSAKTMGPTPNSGLLDYAKGVPHAKSPTRGNTRSLSR